MTKSILKLSFSDVRVCFPGSLLVLVVCSQETEIIPTVGMERIYFISEALTVVLEKTLESPLDCKEIQPVHPKEDQSWIFTGKTDAEAETPTLWPPDVKNRLIAKDPDAGKDWRQEEKGMTEDEMVGWHHRLNEHEFK